MEKAAHEKQPRRADMPPLMHSVPNVVI